MTRTQTAVVTATTAVALFLSLVGTASAADTKKKKKETKGGDTVNANVTVAAPTATVKVEEPTAKVTVAEPTAHVAVTEPAASGTVEVAPVVERGEGANRAGFSVAGQVGFLAGNGGYSTFAVGARAGYTFPFHLYLGVDATFYFASLTVISLAPEVGYDIGIGNTPMVIRPYVGLGLVDVTGVPLGGGAAFMFYPGGEFLYYLTEGLFVGGDLRIPLFFESGATGVGFNLMGTIGYKF